MSFEPEYDASCPHCEEAREVARVLSKPNEEFTRRNAAKNDAGFLARQRPIETPDDVVASVRATHSGWTAYDELVKTLTREMGVVVKPGDDPEVVARAWWWNRHGETPEQSAARR